MLNACLHQKDMTALTNYRVYCTQDDSEMNPKNSPRLTADDGAARRRLLDVRDALIKLHKALIDSERIGYEQTFGAVGTTGDFLQLVIRDPWFAWLRPVSELIVGIDEALDAEEPISARALEKFVTTARALLVATETGEGFSKHYYEALQRDPDVVLAQGAMTKLFGSEKGRAAQ